MNAKVIDHQEAIKNMMAERYLLRELSENERDAYEAHLFDCQACFEQVKAGNGVRESYQADWRGEAAIALHIQPAGLLQG